MSFLVPQASPAGEKWLLVRSNRADAAGVKAAGERAAQEWSAVTLEAEEARLEAHRADRERRKLDFSVDDEDDNSAENQW